MWQVLWQDLRYSARVLRRNPGFTLAAVLILAIAIGVNTAIFSVVHTVLLNALPYKEPQQLVVLGEASSYADFGGTTPGNFLDYQSQLHSFEGVAAISARSCTLTGLGIPVKLDGLVVSFNFFDVLGAKPLLGRTINPQIDRPHGPRAAVLSYSNWKQNFSGNPEIIGKPVSLDGESFTVVGVMPSSFFTPRPAEIWLSPHYEAPEPRSDSPPEVMQDRGDFNFLRPYARLRHGVSLPQAQAELRAFSERLAQAYPADQGKSAKAVPMLEWYVGKARLTLLTLQAAAGLILLIACTNIANLLLARGSIRQREMAVRSALGAGRNRLLHQTLAESILLAVLGGVVGILLGVLGVYVVIKLQPGDLPRLNELKVDGEVLVFSVVVSLLTALVAGVFPAWRGSRPDLTETLKQGGRSTTSGGGHLRKALVVFELTLSFAVLVALSLLVRSFSNLLSEDPGFAPDNVLAAELALPSAKYDTDQKARAFFGDLLQQARALPGVSQVGLVSSLPLGRNGLTGILSVGSPDSGESQQLTTEKRVVSAGYFSTLKIPLLQGRYFAETDDQRGVPVAIVNDRFARTTWAGQSPLGKKIKWGGGPWMTIVGVVGNVSQRSLEKGLTLDSYAPYQQVEGVQSVALVIRSDKDPSQLGNALRREVLKIDPEQAVSSLFLLRDNVSKAYAMPRFQVFVIATLGLVALVLAVVGIYGVMTYIVSRRRHEFGIRLALGAEPNQFFRSVLGEILVMACLGILAGAATSLALVQMISSLLYEVKSTDLGSYGISCVVVLGAALLAGYVPARRAMNSDPLSTLRDE
ncbi:MAG TPA: ABC transporter permease [Thermoanaerobaculia bacterium]|jgi:putative ABC transport system permease protein|nr:ABC transporter permease [Thermoanaerobaculia bacterium]